MRPSARLEAKTRIGAGVVAKDLLSGGSLSRAPGPTMSRPRHCVDHRWEWSGRRMILGWRMTGTQAASDVTSSPNSFEKPKGCSAMS